MTAPSTLKPSALVAAARIIASDGPGEVVRKLDAACDAAVAHRSDLPSGAASLGTYRNVDDGATYTWGTCDDGFFRFDQFGWATWPTQEGFSRALLLAAAPQGQAREAPAALAWPVAHDELERMATFANMASRCGKDRSSENLRKLAETLQHLADQASAVATSAPAAPPGVVFDMVALVKQLVLEHRVAEPNSLLASQALGYLKSHGLLDSPLRVHGDDSALDRFALAMRAKLAAARAKGRGGWETCPPEALNRMLHEHLEKGDPRDVANFCMFLWHTGHRTTTPAPAAPAVDAMAERDAAFEAVRKRLCGLQRYSFALDDDGVVRRAEDRTGNWIEFDDAHALFDPVAVDAAIAAQAKEGGEAA